MEILKADCAGASTWRRKLTAFIEKSYEKEGLKLKEEPKFTAEEAAEYLASAKAAKLDACRNEISAILSKYGAQLTCKMIIEQTKVTPVIEITLD